MPPSSQSGPGKKVGPNALQRQRSRNTTPTVPLPTASLPPIEHIDTEYLELRVETIRDVTYDDIVDANASTALIPDSKSLDGMILRLQKLQEIVERRSNFCDKGMRLLAAARKNRGEEAEEGAGVEEKVDKKNKKKRKAAEVAGEVKIERSSPQRDTSKTSKHARNDLPHSSPSKSPNKMDVDKKDKKDDDDDDDDDDDESSEDEDPRPLRPVPQAMTFGEDPSTFPDPTIYEILLVTKDTPVELKKGIYSVAVFPESDLSDLIAGDPPDKDYSLGKVQNQIAFSTFSSYIEPYFRPFTEEDMGFLRERGDRVLPFHMPKRGKKFYADLWAEEDGMDVDPPTAILPPNQARGSIEHMDDDIAETDKLSIGPLLTRLLQAMRPEGRGTATDEKNGDMPIVNGEDGEENVVNAGNLPPATQMPDCNTEAWKKAVHPKVDYTQADERLRQELKHIGFMPLEGNFDGDYDGHFDDEVTGRLRFLQERLRTQMLINGARKARLTELVKERMAFQEYQTILEDLDTQVQNAYLKRTRTIGKSKKKSRPGAAAAAAAAAAAGVARPGIGDLAKTVMERRRKWMETIGAVFEDDNLVKVPRGDLEGTSIFKEGDMAELVEREKEVWDEEVEE